MTDTVKFPSNTDEVTPDLVNPLVTVLTSLKVLPQSLDGHLPGTALAAAFGRAKADVSVIQSNATALSKWWAAAVGLLGGGTAISSLATNFWHTQSDNGRVATIAGIAAILVASVVAIAFIVHGDVSARSRGTVALFEARARVATTFMTLASGVPSANGDGGGAAVVAPAHLAPGQAAALVAASGKTAWVTKLADGTTGHLRGLRVTPAGELVLGFTPDGVEAAEPAEWVSLSALSNMTFTY